MKILLKLLQECVLKMIIYKTTNLINGKIYIGKDEKNNQNYYGSGKSYLFAEKKHGKENFKKAIIDSSDNLDELCLKEIFWIDFYDARNKRIGYNIAPGGKGGDCRSGMKSSEETKQKLRKPKSEEMKQKLRGRIFSAEHKAKISSSKQGHIVSEDTKRKMSVSHSGVLLQEKHKLSLSAALQGHIVSEETRRKIGLAHRGKIISDEHKQKMSESAKRRWHSDEHAS